MKYTISTFVFGFLFVVGLRASTIISVESITSNPGTSGTFDVSLTNEGPSNITVAAFTFGLAVNNPAISFTDANTSTVSNSYIFAGHSLFGPDLTGSNSGQSLLVSDVFSTPLSGTVVDSGATFDLGHILFTVGSNSSPGPFTVTLDDLATSLSDPSGTNITINTLSNGTLTVTGAPEPSSLLLLLAGAGFILVGRLVKSPSSRE